MKYKLSYWIILKPFIKKYLKQNFDNHIVKTIFKNAKEEYRALLARADDIGSNNPMASNLYLSLLFLSFLTSNRDMITEKILINMIQSVIEDPFIKRIHSMDFNSEKDLKKFKRKMLKNSNWAEKHREMYPEAWKFNFENKHHDGYYCYFTKCPIAKFFKDNHLEDLTHIFCDLDYLTIKAEKGKLIRNYTLANGDDKCDFWIFGDKIKDPK